MSAVLWAFGITLFGLPPTAARTEQSSALVGRGPRLTAHDVLTGSSWAPEPDDGRISKMHKLLALTTDDDPQKPDFWFRLGATCEWWWEHERGRADGSHQRRAQAHFSEAIDAYRMATTFKRYDRIDGALFGLVRLHLAASDVESARSYIDRLGSEHPGSRYFAQANAFFADALFDRGELAVALARYSMVEQANDPLTQPYALYRKGWCFLRRGDLDAARFAFAEAARAADKASNRSANRIVGRQAERDLAAIQTRS